MKTIPNCIIYFSLFIFTIIISCTKTEEPAIVKSSAKEILTFAFNGLNPPVSCTISGTTISATLPAGTDASKLVPTIAVSEKATISATTGVIQDFTKSVIYTVTAEDGSKQIYTVNITVLEIPKSSAKDISKFSFNSLSPVAVATIDAIAKTIKVTLPANTNVKSLVPTILFSEKATVSPASGIAQDFTNPVIYKITAEDGTSQNYTVTITVLQAILPTIDSGKAENILTTTANTTGALQKAGTSQITAYGHCWSSKNQIPTINDSKYVLTASGNFPLYYNGTMNGLTANTTYYFRAYATTSDGTAYSNTVFSFKTADIADVLLSYKDITVTLNRGDAYSGIAQPCLLNLTSGKVFNFGDGAKNASNVDLILQLYSNSNKYNGDDILLMPPSKALDWDVYWGDFPTKLIAQNWTTYKATKLNYLSTTKYPPNTGWDKINSVTDLSSIIKNEYITLTASYYTAMKSDGTPSDDRIFVFQTKEGKQGVLRITDGSKKPTTYTLKFDIKVQK